MTHKLKILGNRWVIASVSSVMIAALIGWRVHSNHQAEARAHLPPAVPRVTVIRTMPGEIANAVAITGIISAKNDLPIGAEGEGGRVTAVLVEVGQHVRRGQVLARVEPQVAESQVAAATAALEEARASAAATQAELARAERARDSFSVEELERRRTAARTAQARVNVTQAQEHEARTRWSRTQVLAPSAGTVLTRNAEVGQIVSAGSSALFHLAQDGEIEMRGQVAEQDMPRLHIGQPTEVYVAGVAAPYVGRVWQLGAVIDAQSRLGSVRVVLPKTDSNLRPGAFARASVTADTTPGVLLPQTALLSEVNQSYVLVVDRESRVQRRSVTVAGARGAGLLVSSGLRANDRVVASAGAFLRDGERVIAVDAGDATLAGSTRAAAALSGHGTGAVSAELTNARNFSR